MPNQQAQAQRKGITHVPTTDHYRHIRHHRHRSRIVLINLPAELVHRVAALRFSDDHLELLTQLQFEFKLALGNDELNRRRTNTSGGVSTPSSAATYRSTCPGCRNRVDGDAHAHDCGVW